MIHLIIIIIVFIFSLALTKFIKNFGSKIVETIIKIFYLIFRYLYSWYKIRGTILSQL